MPGPTRPPRQSTTWLKAFWQRAYRENVTGLAAMVAYNLMLAVFPFALLILFVLGQVLKIHGVEESVLNDLQRLFPNTESGTLSDVLGKIENNSTTIGIAAFVGSLWIGASFWGAMDTAFCRIYHVECRGWVEQKRFSFAMLVVVVLFFGASIFLPAIESAIVSSTDRLPFGLSDIQALDTLVLLGAALLITFAICCLIFWAVPKGPHALARGLARCAFGHPRHRPRQLALPDLPDQRLQPLALRLDPRLHPHRPALVLRAGLAIMAGAVINSLRFELHDTGEMPYGPGTGPCQGPPDAVPAARRRSRDRRRAIDDGRINKNCHIPL